MLYTALVEQGVGREAAVDIAEILERNVKVKNALCCVCLLPSGLHVRHRQTASPAGPKAKAARPGSQR